LWLGVGPRMSVVTLSFIAFMAYRNFGWPGVLGMPCLLLAMLYFRQNSMLYIGGAKGPYMRLPSQFGMNIYENARIICSDGVKIAGWLIKQPQSRSRPTIIMFHGNAGTIMDRLPNAQRMINATKCNLLMVDYRGYGPSEGEPTEEGLQRDAQAALEWAIKHEDVDEDNIFLFGRSLGGAVAIWLAAESPTKVKGLIVENTFCGIREMASALFPYLTLLPPAILEMMLENHWRSEELIARLPMPVLFLAGQLDEIVPAPQMDALHARLRESEGSHPLTEIVRFAEGKHNETWLLPDYDAHWTRWLRKASGCAISSEEQEVVEDKDKVDVSKWSNVEIR